MCVWLESTLLHILIVSSYNKPPAMQVDPLSALALDKKTSCAIISEGPKPHYK